MTNFEATSVYGLDPADNLQSIQISTSEVQLAEDEIIVNDDDARRPLHVTGLSPNDFAVTAHVLYEEDDTVEVATIGYLVTHCDEFGDGILVPGDSLLTDPATWLSPRLKFTLSGVEAGELDQFSLSALGKYVTDRGIVA